MSSRDQEEDRDMATSLEAFLAPGEPCPFGCAPEDMEHWLRVTLDLGKAARKPVVVVTGWQWWDLNVTEERAAEYRALGFEPARLWADQVISDSARRWPPGSWVFSTALKQLHHDCIFQTRNSFYLMLGAGHRKRVDQALVQSIF